uniref:Uncharacterized protein n=1 Tax=Globodera rostochiensis TaxID=31243 RepID=A0A914HXP0_GLORO
MAFTVVVLLVMRMFMFVNPQQQLPSSDIDALPSNNSNKDFRSSCELLVQCELAINRSRMAISERCGLSPEFEELFRLSERRFDEFGACVLTEDGPSNGTEAECSESELSSIGTTTPTPESGCWRSLAGLREQCQRLQQCCKTANGCMVNIGTSDATMALRAQHIKINQKTLQCRQTHHPQGPTSSAAVDSSPLSETEIFSPGDTGPSPAGPPAPPVSARLHSVLTASVPPRVIVPTRAKNGKSLPKGRIEQFGETKPPPSVGGRRSSRRLSQYMADHRPIGIFSGTKKKKALNGDKQKTAAAPLRLVGHKLRHTFALPARLNFRRLRLFAARSHRDQHKKQAVQQLMDYHRQIQAVHHKTEAEENDWIFWQRWPRKEGKGIRVASATLTPSVPLLTPNFVPTAATTLPLAITVSPRPSADTVFFSLPTVFPTLMTTETKTETEMKRTKTEDRDKEGLASSSIKPPRKKSARLSQFSARPKKVYRTSMLRLIAHRQPEGFALPSRLDFHRMRLFAARPELARSFASVAQRREHFRRLRNWMDSFGRDQKEGGAKAAKRDRIGLAQIEAELSFSPTSSSPPKTSPPPLPPLIVLSSTPSAAMFPQIWTKPYPRGPNGWGELEAQLSTPEATTPAIGTTATSIGERNSPNPPPRNNEQNGAVVDKANELLPSVTPSAEKAPSLMQTAETNVLFELEKQRKSKTRSEGNHFQKEQQKMELSLLDENSEQYTDEIPTTPTTTTTTPTESTTKGTPPTESTTKRTTPTQRFGGKSRSSGRARSRAHGVVPKHAGEARRERPLPPPNSSTLHSSLDGDNSLLSPLQKGGGYRRKVLLLAHQMKRLGALRKDRKPMLPLGIRRAPPPNKRIGRPPSPGVPPPPQLLVFSQSDSDEMKRISGILERFLEKHLLEKKGWNNSISQPPDQSPLSANHCFLFVACMLQLRSLQSDHCRSLPEAGRPVPGPPRRRFGRCNSRLLPLFERADSARAELERGAEECLEENVRNGTARAKSSCPSELPVQLPLGSNLECPERVALLHQHCKKLGRCCETLESCQNRVGTSGLARRVRLEEEKLAVRSTQCQKQAHEMFRILRDKQRADEELLRVKRRRKMKTLLL